MKHFFILLITSILLSTVAWAETGTPEKDFVTNMVISVEVNVGASSVPVKQNTVVPLETEYTLEIQKTEEIALTDDSETVISTGTDETLFTSENKSSDFSSEVSTQNSASYTGNYYGSSSCISMKGILYLSAVAASRGLGITLYFSPVSNVVMIRYKEISAKLIINQFDAIINGELMQIPQPLTIYEDEVYIPTAIFSEILGISNDVISGLIVNPRTIYSQEEKKQTAPPVANVIKQVVADSKTATSEIKQEQLVSHDQETSEIPYQERYSHSRTKITFWTDSRILSRLSLELLSNFQDLVDLLKGFETDTLEIRILSGQLSEEELNNDGTDVLAVIVPGFLQDETYSGISFFIGNSMQEDPGHLTRKDACLESMKNSLPDYTGSISALVLPLSYYSYVRPPSVCIELFNLNSAYDTSWLGEAERRALLARAFVETLVLLK